jgi:acetolactate synthase-1/2/3 large subunit
MTSLNTPTFAAEGLLARIKANGIDYLFANAGTDFAPVIEGFANGMAKETPLPTAVIVPHETAAMGMAHGYYLVTGKPQAVMVHVNVGLGNCVMGVINAAQENIPMLVMSGRTPLTEFSRDGSRMSPVQYAQEMRDQGAMVREFVKWDYQLPNGEVLENTVDRALNIATAEPKGPVYLTLPREVLAGSAKGLTYESPSRHRTPSAPFPDTRAIDEAAEMIARAENPLIITSSAGRDEADVAKLAALAEAFAIPVSQRKPRYVALPSDHPMHLGYEPDSMLQSADLIIVIECDVPWIPGKRAPNPDAKIIHLGVDPLFSNYPMRSFNCDLAITGVLGATLPALTEALGSRYAGAKSLVEARRAKLAVDRAAQRERWAETLKRGRDMTPMSAAWITHCIDQVKGEDGILIKESPVTFEHIRFNKPGTMFSIGAAGGLGWGLGTALGVKAASPDKLVICTCGDGAYMFGNPIPAHYVSAAEKLPMLTIVFNNQMWGAVKRNTREVYPDGFAAKSNREPLTYFDPQLDFSKAVEVAGGYGETVSDPADMPKALERAVKVVTGEKRQALLNVICRGP